MPSTSEAETKPPGGAGAGGKGGAAAQVEEGPRVLTIPRPSSAMAPQTTERKDIPFAVVLFAGILIWVIIFGSIFSYAAFAPCSFVAVAIGERKTLDILSERLSMDFTNQEQCRHFLRMTVVGNAYTTSS